MDGCAPSAAPMPRRDPAPGQGRASHVGRIGPNAVTRLREAVEDRLGRAAVARIFHDAGCGRWLAEPPGRMVDESSVVALYEALARRVGPAAVAIAADAGRRTGDYLLARRIPRPAQWVLRALPPGLAARALFAAIARHAWTFAGSGALTVRAIHAVRIEGGPFARPGLAAAPLAAFYGAVFERLFRALVSRATVARAEATPHGCAIGLVWSRSGAAQPLRNGA